EFAVAGRMSDRTIRARMEWAVDLVDGFPATFALFEEGRISEAHVRAIVDAGSRLEDDDSRAEFEQIILPRAVKLTAGQLGSLARKLADDIEPLPLEERLPRAVKLTAGQLGSLARKLADDIEPLPLEERHEEAMADRSLRAAPLPDGMGELTYIGPAVTVYAMHDRATQMARTIYRTKDETDERTLDQIRADVFAEIALAGLPTADLIDQHGGDALTKITATVQVTVPWQSLTGVGEESAFLAGYGPIPAEAARRLAGEAATWVRLFQDPDTGCLKTVDTYTPTKAQRRFLIARDEHCRFPGCRQPAIRCEDDHTIPYSHGGPTTVRNLANLCRAHHVLKHNSNWNFRHGPGGVIEVISPTGRAVKHKPTPVVRFEASAEIARADLGTDPPPF
ncbi:HNH endonuclease signature motif containing protein, partial [Microbacterium sp. Root53]|uniref:HNH endonuclease signature motif containing protein n=1 Tax=Microbacterium sp. Root53 TaxID=1736553 RepID=UPI001F3AAF13